MTGTDTGVGKTFVTGCCLAHLLRSAKKARALKPFCSGERTDALLLWELQKQRIPLESINPFYFKKPVAPWTAARAEKKSITLADARHAIEAQTRECDFLLIEGAGGLLSPLGENFNAADLIVQLGCEVILVAGNRLGVLNHTLLSVEALTRRGIRGIKIALIDIAAPDLASQSNEKDLRSLCPAIPLVRLPFVPNYKPEAPFFENAAVNLDVAGLLE